MLDVLEGIQTFKHVLDHGSIELLDCMPRNRNVERAIVEAARVSTGNDKMANKLTAADKRLIERLYKDRHTSPFEMIELKFAIDMPIFVARQWFRHRTGSFNEWSARYSKLDDKFYVPERVRMQHSANKQMSADVEASDELNSEFMSCVSDAISQYGDYSDLCNKGVARELARIILPVNVYTRVYWKVNLHNFLNFMSLRLAPDAQYEIRVYAEAAYEMVKQLCPVTCAAFEKYRMNSISMNADELAEIRECLNKSDHGRIANIMSEKTIHMI